MLRKRARKIDDDERVVHDRERSRRRTMDRAVRLLAAKPRSVGELTIRLLDKRWTDREIVDAVIAKLTEYGYLNDEQYARDLAASKLRQRPQGRRKLQLTMSQKNLDREIVDAAISEAFEANPEEGLIDRAIEKRVRLKGVPETRDDKKKFLDHLLRQGFGYDLIREKMSVLPRLADDDVD